MSVTINGTTGIDTIQDGIVSTAKIAADAVTTPKIADTVNLGRRNLVINGAMQVNQRGTTFTGANATSGFIVDRFDWLTNATGSFDASSSTTSPDGFSNSIGISCTTAETSPSAGAYQNIITKLEAQSIQHLNGSSGTIAFIVSFYVYSSKTGIYTCEVRKIDSGRHIAQEFTINSANTWERKTISIPADSTGSIDNDNGDGLRVYIWTSGGTTYTSGTLATSWGTFTNANRVSSNNVNIGDSTSNTFYYTGLQVEIGDTATPFEHRSYGEELYLCQRYFYRIDGGATPICMAMAYSTNEAYGHVRLPQKMRVVPSLSFSSYPRLYKPGTQSLATLFQIDGNNSNSQDLRLRGDRSGHFTAGHASWFQLNDSSQTVDFDSEI